mmetsp:Transcript_34341/g.96803  ORF Transcript_34341/g.96803 Transcript_34341/m.96803 type:complete len:260 (-) Transcript_34341:917-1696(-)
MGRRRILQERRGVAPGPGRPLPVPGRCGRRRGVDGPRRGGLGGGGRGRRPGVLFRRGAADRSLSAAAREDGRGAGHQAPPRPASRSRPGAGPGGRGRILVAGEGAGDAFRPHADAWGGGGGAPGRVRRRAPRLPELRAREEGGVPRRPGDHLRARHAAAARDGGRRLRHPHGLPRLQLPAQGRGAGPPPRSPGAGRAGAQHADAGGARGNAAAPEEGLLAVRMGHALGARRRGLHGRSVGPHHRQVLRVGRGGGDCPHS